MPPGLLEMSSTVKMFDIIREAAAVPVCFSTFYYSFFCSKSASRKRKQGKSDPLTRTSSALDGAVDDLFSASTIPEPSGSHPSAGNPMIFAQSADKSELVFDSEGNMVLQTVSHSSERISSAEATTTVDSATCGYDHAYRRPKPTKWSAEDTLKFYEALESYGSDQMLINTMLPKYTSVQIRQKFKAEQRNNPARLSAAVYGSRKQLTHSKFEEQHGAIQNPVQYHTTREITALPPVEEPTSPLPLAVEPVATPEDPLDSLFA